MEAGTPGAVGRSYTKGRRQPYLIRKWPGSNWALPLGPYTITQLVVFVGSVYVLLSYRNLWAHFGPMNLVIGVGLPLLLTYATRHTRVEGRDPLRAGMALTGLLLSPRTGYLGGEAFRPPGTTVRRGGWFPVASLPASLTPPPPPATGDPFGPAPGPGGPPEPGGPGGPPGPRPPDGPPGGARPTTRAPAPRPWLADLLDQAAQQREVRR